jgi:lysyl-tRNA synthetase class 2
MTGEWWRPDRHADRRGFLLQRGRIKAVLRKHLELQDFVEVECAGLQVSPGNEAHLHAFSTTLYREGGGEETLYLHTSPEFACKKLLAAGERRIFDFARVWRNREQGPLHAPEFTMLEWYRAGEPYEQVMDDAASFARIAAETAGRSQFEWRGRTCDPYLEPERLTLAEAFDRYAGIDLMAVLDDRDSLAAVVAGAGMRVGEDDVWADLFSRVLVERIEHQLGVGRLTMLCEYPASEAALARRKPSDARVSERFEMYACGVELANGFGELTDAADQRRRFEIEMAEKLRIYGEQYPLDEDFLAALAIMPEASGVAMGFDRLVVLASGARSIADVLWTPAPDAGQT